MKIYKIDRLSDAVKLHTYIMENNEDMISLDFSNASFVRNNYLSILGLALELQKEDGKKIKIIPPLETTVRNSMKRIGFLSRFSDDNIGIDNNNTMVKYTHIPLENYDQALAEFYIYFKQQLERKVQNLSPELSNKIIQKIFELFSNVFRHSESKLGLFCSGQFYPSNDKFYFTIVDGGVTIKNNVNKYFKNKFNKQKTLGDKIFGIKKFERKSGLEAIKWSMEEKHSTTGEGGLGLSLLKDLILKSNGVLDIISNDGHYFIRNNKTNGTVLNSSFDGTIISIGLDTDINKYFYLVGEKNEG
jgi:hypothetical protein